jgi:hypothetical protein
MNPHLQTREDNIELQYPARQPGNVLCKQQARRLGRTVSGCPRGRGP